MIPVPANPALNGLVIQTPYQDYRYPLLNPLVPYEIYEYRRCLFLLRGGEDALFVLAIIWEKFNAQRLQWNIMCLLKLIYDGKTDLWWQE